MALFDSEHVDCIRLLRYRVYNVQKEHTHPKIYIHFISPFALLLHTNNCCYGPKN